MTSENSNTLSVGGPGRPMRLLLVDTTRWALGARLAAAFMGLGCEVATVRAGKGYPADSLARIAMRFRYRGLSGTKSIRDAMHSFEPDLVVPMADRSVTLLHELYSEAEATEDTRIIECIERSVGRPESYGIVDSRYALLHIAAEQGIQIPALTAIHSVEDLHRFALTHPLPWAIKADGSWGGEGVKMVTTVAEAENAYRKLGRRAGVASLIVLLAANRDRALHFADWLRPAPKVSAQSWIDGAPATCAVVCWKGEVLAGIAVEVTATASATGPSRVVTVVEGEEMLLAARRIAARLQLSGFLGFDFMIEKGSGTPYLIEMNARCTPCCSLQLGKGRNLPAALFARVTGVPEPDLARCTPLKTIAYFPHKVWGANQPAGEAAHCYYDVPLEAPELMPILLNPWRERSLLGVLVDRIGVSRPGRAEFSAGAMSTGQEEGTP